MHKITPNTVIMPLLVAPVVLVVLISGTGWAKVDNAIYADLLQRYVHNGHVDYQGFQNEEDMLDRYLDELAQVDPDVLSRDERFAFYVNAYNAWTIKFILSRYPDLQSIKDLGSLLRSPWKKKFVRIDGKVLTLDNIEHDILRPQFKDPRVHFAVNCASIGCPPLLNEPYAGDRLDKQLNRVAKDFINDPQRNRLDGNVLYVSKIFKWFAADFNHDIPAFFQKYAREPMKTELRVRASDIRINYLNYDWSLNGK
jgi:hypothetical protein